MTERERERKGQKEREGERMSERVRDVERGRDRDGENEKEGTRNRLFSDVKWSARVPFPPAMVRHEGRPAAASDDTSTQTH